MEEEPRLRQKKLTVLAYGEGEDEKIFLRHLKALYCRSNLVSVQTGSAGGGDLDVVLVKSINARRGEKRDIEFILLDTIPAWSEASISKAQEEGIRLIGNAPCLEALFLTILGTTGACEGIGAGRCKSSFEEHCPGGNFNEDNCALIFTKAVLNEARKSIPQLNYMIRLMETGAE